MPVGSGSIKRAAKLNAGAEASKKTETEKSATAAKKTEAVKKAETARKTVAAKKAEPEKKTAMIKETKNRASGNQVCHLTEELPVYLL